MAYLNDNVVAFSPSITLEQGAANLVKGSYDASNGDAVLKPKNGEAFSEVAISGVCYSPQGSPYVRNLKVYNAHGKYDYSDMLDSISFEKGQESYLLPSFCDCERLNYIYFADGACFEWLDAYRFTNSPIEMMIFGAISENAVIDIWTNNMGEDLTELVYLEVPEGWAHDLAVYNSDLTADNVTQIIQNAAQLDGDARTLWLGDRNIEKVDPSIIDIGINKGWDIY